MVVCAWACFVAGLAMGQPRGPSARPQYGDEVIILRTVAGDAVLALYPEVAPKHVEQILKLVKLAVYDHTRFVRVEPNFVIQLGEPDVIRGKPLTPDQKAAIKSLPLEISPAVRHQRGTLTMARQDNDKNSARTSFSVVLGNAEHLDGNYTIFGEVAQGMEVFDRMVEVPRRPGTTEPTVPLEVYKAEVVSRKAVGGNVDKLKLRPAVSITPTLEPLPRELIEQVSVVVGGLLLIVAVAVAGFVLGQQLPARYLQAFFLIIVLSAGFLIFLILAPYGRYNSYLALGLFLAVLALLRLMSRFESPS